MEKKYIYLKSSSLVDLFIHLGITVSLFTIIILYFFHTFLLDITFHGETVTVPDLSGMSVDEVEKFLDQRDLEFMVSDSSYSEKHKPYVVLTQSPLPGEKVKRNRKLLLTVNPKLPPKVKLPNIIDMPFSEAQRTLRNADLKLGQISYKKHIAVNSILEQSVQGQVYTDDEINEGVLVAKGTYVDVLIGDGVGDVEFKVPDLVLMTLDEAEFVIKGQELVLGTVQFVYDSPREIGTVIRQSPKPFIGKVRKGVKPGTAMDDREANMIRSGEIIDLWVVGNPAASPLEEIDEADLSPAERKRRDSLEELKNTNINIRKRDDFEKFRKKKLGIEEKDSTKTQTGNQNNNQN